MRGDTERSPAGRLERLHSLGNEIRIDSSPVLRVVAMVHTVRNSHMPSRRHVAEVLRVGECAHHVGVLEHRSAEIIAMRDRTGISHPVIRGDLIGKNRVLSRAPLL